MTLTGSPPRIGTGRLLFDEGDAAVLVVAAVETLVLSHRLQLHQRAKHRLRDGARRSGMVLMRATQRLRNDAVDQTQLPELLRGDTHAGRGVGRIRGISPENRRRGLR